MTINPAPPPLNDPQTYEIIGAAMAVHRALGCGFLEVVYRSALAIEMTARAIPYASEVALRIKYRDELLAVGYRVDFVCFDRVIVEVKAIPMIAAIENTQVINYLRAANLERGLLLNCGATSLQHKRFVNTSASCSVQSNQI